MLENIAPLITITVTDRPSSPWFDGECRASRRRIRALARCYQRSRLPSDCETWRAALEDKRVLFTQKNQQYWTRQLHDCIMTLGGCGALSTLSSCVTTPLPMAICRLLLNTFLPSFMTKWLKYVQLHSSPAPLCLLGRVQLILMIFSHAKLTKSIEL